MAPTRGTDADRALDYQHTEIGVIPAAWSLEPLLKVVSLPKGQVDPRREPYSSMVLIAPDHVESSTGRVLVKQTAEEQGAVSGKYSFSAGDIVYSKIRPYLRKAILADFDGICSADMYPLRPAAGVSGAFIFEVLLGERFSAFAQAVSARSGIPKINRKELAEFRLALPPQAEQRAIAKALSDVDGLLGALEALIVKKRAIKLTAMQQLLTGKTRLPGSSGEWEARSLGDLLIYERPDRYIVRSAEYTGHGHIPVLTGNKSFILGYTDEQFGVCSALPVIIFDDFTTDSKFVTFPFKVKSSAIKLLRPKHRQVNLRYVFERMQLFHPPLGDHKRFYISEYQRIEFPCPESAEQAAIVAVLSDMDSEITVVEARRNKIRAIKQGMMQQLLTGRVRLGEPSFAQAGP